MAALLFLALVFGVTLWILSPFLVSLAWACILAYVSWPLYGRLNRMLSGRNTLSALLMTPLVTVILLAPLTWVTVSIASDVVSVAGNLRQFAAQGLPALPPWVQNLPGGQWLVEQYAKIQYDPQWLQARIDASGLTNPATWGVVAGELGRNLAKFGLAVFALFFIYRNGVDLIAQFGRVSIHWLGPVARGYLDAVGVTVNAVVFGVVVTAIAQGTLAGLGYWAAGIEAPVLWGVVTALLSLVPFLGGTVWIGLSLGLLTQGETGAAIGLLLWGALVVSSIDNLIRPLVIGMPTRIPYLLVLLGVLGGINALGMIGLFIGPILLAVSIAIWREWLEQAADKEEDPA